MNNHFMICQINHKLCKEKETNLKFTFYSSSNIDDYFWGDFIVVKY